MIKKSLHIISLSLIGLLNFSYIFSNPAQKIDLVIDSNLDRKLDFFLDAPIQNLESLIGKFTQNELQQIWSAYKKLKPIQEQRILRLIEESSTRKAEDIAQKNLIFLFIAITCLILLLTLFSFLTYKKQCSLEKKLTISNKNNNNNKQQA